MQPILETRNLVKRYAGPPEVRAVNGVDLRVRTGVCFGLLGPNGAGKTTSIEIMEGILAPSSGEVLFQGEPIGPAFRERSGIQFQNTQLPDYLRVGETLRMFQSFYAKQASLQEVIGLCSLSDLLDRDTHKLSGGQRQRVLLALALVNDPDILFLDEPTTGLDPQARRGFWDLINKIKARGKTILMTTHYMEEAYVLCDEIAIMDRGRIIAQGAPDSLLKQHFQGVLIELPSEDVPAGSVLRKPKEGVYSVIEREGRVDIQTQKVDQTLAALVQSGVPLHHLRIRSQTLDDLFLALTGKELRA